MTDRDLGMSRRITRRDFLNGMAIGIGGAMTLPHWAAALAAADDYPPALTGLRGSHEGSFEVFHRLRDMQLNPAGPNADTGERYDLVVVGGGISGLAAAHFYRQAAGRNARVLVLENHDDFGGHARRNEFTANGRLYIGYGGTQSIDSPSPYSAVAKGLVQDLGIDVSRYEKVLDEGIYESRGLQPAFFFDQESFGVDRLVVGASRRPSDEFLKNAPVSDAVRRDVKRLLTDPFDPMPGLSSADKKARLARMSYADFVTKEWKLDPGVLPLYQTRTHGLFGVGVDAVPAQDAWALGFPGFQGMALDKAPGKGQNHDSIIHPDSEHYYFHFPDGNAAIARLLVRRLIPGSIPGRSMDDIVTARADYGRLDQPSSPVRLRLNSTVVGVRHAGPPEASKHVEVVYSRGGTLEQVQAGHVVLACWHTVIPYICPEMPDRQKDALAYAIKVPLVYTNVFIRNWTAFQKLRVRSITSPGFWHTSASLDFPVSLGGYRCAQSPAEPIVLHLSKTPCRPGLPTRDQHRVGRTELFMTSFETIERSIRQELARALAGGGFDPGGDILAITVNRWPHGYAYQYNSLSDPFWLEGGETPCEVARQRFGRIALANADAAAYSYTDAAIDHAHRAVQELTEGRV